LRRKEDATRYGIKAKQQVIGISIKRQDEMQRRSVALAQEKTRQELVNELESTAGKKNIPANLSNCQTAGLTQCTGPNLCL